MTPGQDVNVQFTSSNNGTIKKSVASVPIAINETEQVVDVQIPDGLPDGDVQVSIHAYGFEGKPQTIHVSCGILGSECGCHKNGFGIKALKGCSK